MLNTKYLSGILLMVCLMTGIAVANPTLPNHYPAEFELTGVITNVYNDRRIIELDKADYKLHPVYNIYTLRKGVKSTLFELKPGMKIGAKYGTYQGKKVLTDLWILPKSYKTTPAAV